MGEQEKKRKIIYDLLDAETNPKFIWLLYTKQRKKLLSLQRLRRTPQRQLKVNEKIVRTAIIQDLKPDLNLLIMLFGPL